MKKENMLTRAHSKLGASASERWFNCPGSVRLCETVPAQEGGAAALEGTAAHALAEKVFNEPPNAFYYIGKAKKLLGDEFNKHGIEVTKEMATHVQAYVDFVRAKANELGGELVIEKRFHLSHIHPDLFGTADAVIVVPFGEIWVIDFKYGVGHAVEVEENSQLLYYAVGAAMGEDTDKITVCVFQPRCEHEDGSIRTWEFEPTVLKNFAKKLRQRALETEKEDAALLPGKWCQWCNAAGVCPALHRSAIETAKTDFDDPQLPEVERLTDDQIAKVIRYAGMFEKWFKAVKEYARERAKNGDVIKELKVVAGRGARVWKDEEQAKKFLKEHLGEEAFKVTLLSVAQAEEKLGEFYLDGLWEKIPGNPTVAHVTDRRKEIKPDAALDFADADEEISEDDF